MVKRNDNNIGPRKVSKGRTKPSICAMTRPGPVNTQSVVNDDCELMETSELRDADNISKVNLSQVFNMQEHKDVELAKTEMELARMGEVPGCGLSNVCDEMEIILNGGPVSTSTPNATFSLSSMPSLVLVSSAPADSGNDSG